MGHITGHAVSSFYGHNLFRSGFAKAGLVPLILFCEKIDAWVREEILVTVDPHYVPYHYLITDVLNEKVVWIIAEACACPSSVLHPAHKICSCIRPRSIWVFQEHPADWSCWRSRKKLIHEYRCVVIGIGEHVIVRKTEPVGYIHVYLPSNIITFIDMFPYRSNPSPEVLFARQVVAQYICFLEILRLVV